MPNDQTADRFAAESRELSRLNEAEGEIRAILRRRGQECSLGLAATDPSELLRLLEAFWFVMSHACAQLERLVHKRAACAFGRRRLHLHPDYVDNVLKAAILKAADHLEAQYLGRSGGFRLNPDDDRSIVAWVTLVIGNEGVHGSEFDQAFKRQLAEHAIFVHAPDDDAGDAVGIHPVALTAPDPASPARQVEARRTLELLSTRARALDPMRRFAVEAIVMFHASTAEASTADFFDGLEALVVDIWGAVGGGPTLMVIRRFRAAAARALTTEVVLAMVQAVVGRGPRQIWRWYVSFMEPFKAGRLVCVGPAI